MIKLAPNPTSNDGMNLPELSTLLGASLPLAAITTGIKILEFNSAQLLEDIEEFIDHQTQYQLQRTKFTPK